MAKGDIIVGLDIGTTKICAIVGRKNDHGKLDILGLGKKASDGVARGIVTNISKTVETIISTIEEASEKSNIEIGGVYVGIAGQHITSLQHRAVIVRNVGEEEISEKDIRRLINDVHKMAMQPGQQIIHVIPQEYTVDGEPGIREPIGMAGVKLEGNFHVVTGQATQVSNIQKCVNKAHLEVCDILLEPTASSASVLSEEEKEAGVALVDMGGGTTDVAIFQNGVLRHTAVIPLGGNIITEDIRGGCNVMKRQAEQMKVQYGCALADEVNGQDIISIKSVGGREAKEISIKNLAHIIQARVEEIFEHVLFEIKASGYEHRLIGGIVLTGGGAELRHIAQLVEYVTTIETRIGEPIEHLSKGMVEEVRSPMYATGVGLLMQGLEMEEQSEEVRRFHSARETSVASEEKTSGRKSGPGFLGNFFESMKGFFNDDVSDFNENH